MALHHDPEMDGAIPREPHLAILTSDDGRVTAIPVGATMYVILDPTKADHVIPLVLAKVTRDCLTFVAYSSDRKTSRTVRYKAKWGGVYRSALRTGEQAADDEGLQMSLPGPDEDPDL